MRVRLVVKNEGKAQGQEIPITISQFLIGRDPQCNLRPSSAMISKRHCAVLVTEGQVVLRDLDSTNGTFVNDRQLKGEIALKHDDVVKVGPLTFSVRIEAGTSKELSSTGQATPSAAKQKSAQETNASIRTDETSVDKPAAVPPGKHQPKKPAEKPKPKAPVASDDHDEAAMLLLMEGEDGLASTSTDESGVATGSTVMEIPAYDDNAEAKPDDKKAPEKKNPNQIGAASQAAQALLDKFRAGRRK